MGEWSTLSLREAGVSLIDCDHRTPPTSDSGYPYVTIPQLRDGRIDISDARRIAPEHFVEWTRRARPQPNDIVLSRRCNPGESAFVVPGVEFALGQNLVLLRSDGSKVYPPLLRWMVRSPDWWEQVSKYINVGAVFDSLKCADIPKFELRIPPMAEQRAIAMVLGTLDDKIELNRRMSETLEATARALFTECCRTRLPSSEWRASPLTDVVDVLGGGTPKTAVAEFWNGEIPWYSVVDAPKEHQVWVIDTEKKISNAGLENSSTQVLPIGTTIISARGTVGRVALVGVPMAMNQSCYGLRSKIGSRSYFVYFLIRSLVDDLKQRSHGSVFDTITRATLQGLSVAVPPADVVERFESAVGPIMERIRLLLFESKNLASLRDDLLPYLTSGEIRIGDVEGFMGNVA